MDYVQHLVDCEVMNELSTKLLSTRICHHYIDTGNTCQEVMITLIMTKSALG